MQWQSYFISLHKARTPRNDYQAKTVSIAYETENNVSKPNVSQRQNLPSRQDVDLPE